jgi:MFS family permease
LATPHPDRDVVAYRRSPALLVLTVLLGTTLVPINSSMIAVALPAIARVLGHGLAATVWVVSVYLIVMAVIQPIAGRTGDLYGHRRVFLGGLGLFLVSSALAAGSASLATLILFRALQALGAGIAGPNGTAILRRHLASRLPRVLGTVGMVQGLGAAVGPILGAVLVAHFGWSSIFWVNVPVLFAALALGILVLPQDGRVAGRRPDVLGAALLALLLVTLTLGIRTRPVLLAAVAVLGVIFVRWETSRPQPLVDVGLFRRPAFRAATAAIALQNFLMYTVMLATPVLISRDHQPIALSGLLLLLFSGTSSACSWIGGRLTDRWSRVWLVSTAFTVSLLAFANLAWVLPAHRLALNIAWVLVAGVGAGIGGVAIQATTLQAVERDRAGMAAGIYATFRYLGSTLSAAVLAAFPGLPPGYLVVLLGTAALGLVAAQGFRGFVPAADRVQTSG